MTARRVKASARKTTERSTAWTSLISHSQNGNGFVCGLSTRKNLMPASTQCSDDVEPRLPELAPGVRVPVEVVDVLVALGRVLGVLERAVGALLEPLGVLLEPRVVGRGVQREVERDVHAVLARRRAQGADVLLRAELGVDGVVAALLAADRVRRAGVVGAGGQRVVAALAGCDADRVDGREVEDVEAELGDRGDLLLDLLEPAPGAREQLVPGGEGGGDAVDLDHQRRVEASSPRCARRRAPWRRRGRARARSRAARRGRAGPRAPPRSSCGRRPWRGRRPARAARRPRTARRRGPPGRRRACAAARRARSRRRRSRPRSSTASGPSCRRGTRPSQRTPLTCASIGRSGDSTQRRLPGPR